MSEKIELTDTITDILFKLSGGNPGALNVLIQILKSGQSADAIILMLSLDDMRVRGSSVWVGYKDFAGEDINVFIAAIRERDPEMLAVINSERARYA